MGRRHLTALSLFGGAAIATVAAWVNCGGSTNVPRPSAAYPDDGDSSGAGGSSSGVGPSSGGSSGGSGSSSGGSGSSSGAQVDLCGLPMTDAASPIIYNGALNGVSCSGNLPAPRNGGWYAYSEPDAAVTATQMAAAPGCAGSHSCAIHATGSGYSIYAGVGFNFNGGSTNTVYDAGAYSGVEFWAKGNVIGSRTGTTLDGGTFALMNQAIYAEVTGSANGRAGGDEYGSYCVLDDPDGGTWTHCKVDFATATRLGLSTPPVIGPDIFDRTNLWKMQFAFSPASGHTISFDVWIGDVYFY